MNHRRRGPKTTPYEAIFDYAMSLHEAGNLPSAIAELETLRAQYPDEGPILFMLGAAWFELDRYQDALPHFQGVAQLRPKHELTSLALFHCLWELGREEEAMDEMQRFLAIADSAEYWKILHELEQ